MTPASQMSPLVALTHVQMRYDENPRDAQGLPQALARVCERLGWGTSTEDPFGVLVQAGERVVVKPNWVLHQNALPNGAFEPLVTHGALIRQVVQGLLRTQAASVVVGDAPVQGCDFHALMHNSSLATFFDVNCASDHRLNAPVDFRRTVSSVSGAVRTAAEGVRDLSQYVLFDLGAESYLEEVTTLDTEFRVTQYPPALMKRTHTRGRHQYLVAKEIVDATLVVNMPKLKTHKKAGVTCALKNLVGINGNKEYLPHHRVGGPRDGGDCYPEQSVVKRSLERVLDVSNSVQSSAAQRALGLVARGLSSISIRTGDETGVEGAWSGNDTVWRMCLDLNRILQYGRPDGTLAPTRQRRVVNVVDAVVAGHGDGPLAPLALPLGLLLAGESSAAIDWLGARLLGYDPLAIPIAAHAFDPARWPIVDFMPSQIRVIADDGEVGEAAVRNVAARHDMQYPAGWRDAVQGADRDR